MPNDEVREVTPEADQISRIVRSWLQTYPNKPSNKVDFEYLGESTSLTVSTVQAAYKAHSYIYGDYQAQYQFSLLYKTFPTTTSERLKADEILGDFALWAIQNVDGLIERLPARCKFNSLSQNTNAALLGRDADGSEVHQILFTLLYEVKKYG